MKCNFIHIKLKDKYNNNLSNNKILELLKLSIGNNIINLNYIKNKKESSNQNFDIKNDKKYIKKNIGKMIYMNIENIKKIKILNKIFISNNIKRAKIIINNKQYKLKNIIENKTKKNFKIKFNF